MAFRKKNKTRDIVSQKETIDSIHKKMKTQFQETYNQVDDIRAEIGELDSQIKLLKGENDKYNSNNSIPDFKFQNKIWKLEEKRDALIKQIDEIESRSHEKDYLIKTGKILSRYYKIIEKEKEISEMTSRMDFNDAAHVNNHSSVRNTHSISTSTSMTKKPEKREKRDIMDWFNDMDTLTYNMETKKPQLNIKINPNVNQPTNDTASEQVNDKPECIAPGATVDDTKPFDPLDKRKIYDEYMKIIDPNYIAIYDDEFELFDICFHCHNEMVLNHNTGMLNCNNCGMTERIIVDSDKQSHKEPPKEMTSFSYKRINHLNEILSQFQAKETTEIPDAVYDKILLELKKERIDNMTLLTKEKLREILKKIDETDYYEHIPYIINQLNGLPPPVISPEIEEIIRGLFLQAQHPFNTHCPDARKNFLTYGYTLYKLFELLELDEYLPNFKFLKDRKKLYEQEQIWKKICQELKWEFIPSI